MNGCLWSLGLETAITADLAIAFVGPLRPNTFGAGFALGLKPETYADFTSPVPANNNVRKLAPKKTEVKE